MRLAIKEWRADFDVRDRSLVVRRVASGYRPAQLASDERLSVHRAFVARFD
jgi:hypothetical protein